MSIVEYDQDNVAKCQCGNCPVQSQSACTKGKIQNIAKMMEEMRSADGAGMPDPQTMPGLYCSEPVGRTSCDDLNFEQGCICGTCPVHQENNLHSGYYCKAGSAEING
jgi:hypothetical protein